MNNDKISDLDRAVLEISKKDVLLAVANAKTALAEQEKAEVARKLVVTQIFMKYGLTQNDQLNEDGTIIRGGASNVEEES